jgi:hypothetical protein
MSLMDMFRTAMGGAPNSNPGAIPNAQPGMPANPAMQPVAQRLDQQPGPANPNADPLNPTFGQPDPKEPKSPLADFEGFWTIDPKKDGAEPASLADFKFSVDQAKIQQAARGMDFTKVINADVMAAIGKGGPEAQAAMLSAMNTMSQEVMKNAILVSAGIVEGGIKSSGANTERMLPGLVKKTNISNALREDNPLFTSPATAPMLSMLEDQLSRKYPNATAAEITSHARKYLSGFAETATKVLNPADSKQVQPGGIPANADFSTWEV